LKAIHVTEIGVPEVLKPVDVAEPQVNAGEVRIRSEVIAINFHDISARRIGEPGVAVPFIPGTDFAGHVDAVGEDVTGITVGDRMLGTVSHGAYAELAVVSAERTMPIPDGVSFAQAAACPVAGLTAYFLLADNHLGADNTVVGYAAAGSVGCFLGGLMRKRGLHSIGLVSTAEKAEVAKAAGWQEVIVYRQENAVEAVLERTDGKGANLVLDSVAGPDFADSFAMCRVGGTVVLFGRAAGAFPMTAVTNDFMGAWRNLGLRTFFLGTTIAAEVDRLKPAYEILFAGWQAGEINMPMQQMPLSEAAGAHRSIETQQTTGKILLIP